MSGRELDSPHGDFLAVAEAMALSGFDALAAGEIPGAFSGLESWLEMAQPTPPLHRIAEGFVLEPAQVQLIGLLFAAALSEPVARRLAAMAPSGRGVPLWLARRLIPDLAADALAAAGPLRLFDLVALEKNALRIEARVWLDDALLDRLCGAEVREPQVAARIAPWSPDAALANEGLAARLRTALAERQGSLSPAVLVGRMEPAMVAASLAHLGLKPHLMNAGDIPDAPDRDRLARLWSRDAALDGAALLIQAEERPGPALMDFVDRVAGHVIIAGAVPAGGFRRAIRVLAEGAATPAGAADRWRRALGPERSALIGGGLARIAAHFRLDPHEIDTACGRVREAIDAAPTADEAARILWRAAGRTALLPPIAGVSLVEPAYQWDDIVLPRHIEDTLLRVETHVKQSARVMDDWGFAAVMGGRGRGVAALFAGPSGTGKTMAAEVLASSLDLRMMVIDLSQIISKYIGETSKNIAAAFDQAERSGAVMVWNEGDAVWGARGSVGSATDRHVNAEVGDLLQRIEAFRGFTIVTTNLRQAIDPAFLRRFRFIVDFPMPSEDERLRLWRQAFPTAAPVDAINWSTLAALPLTGGNIRNVALGSAFLAAKEGGSISRGLIASELAEELRKHDQPAPRLDWGVAE